ncbi:putative toxin-antitoxin system toxin component, PIN family [Arcicella aquatica]|uniref:Toxin-antitoxin system toxin component, PIN family n=1 Tax=Arcicella aquatica TaxID=217141 RepID=A0ABU5QQI3_9BACT|nr:putative toxin-antitoxin system toxin component, PIN family [Arcicella aquatica]MEA5259342.1 putative toxin-antitoxin system toxin component, PIN family [Arcicella aquatica]
MRILIDTNILLAIVPKRSSERWLYEKLRNAEITLIISNEIIKEYEEKLAWFYSEYFAEIVLEELLNLPFTEQIEAFYKWQLIEEDPDDNKFVDIAIASNADYIITNDKHFRVLENTPFPKVRVLSLQEFKTLIEK